MDMEEAVVRSRALDRDSCCNAKVLSSREFTRGSRPLILLFLFLIICSHLVAQTLQERKIQVLIITGQDKHPWREASPYLKDLLNQSGKFEVRVTEEFRGATAETLKPYDVAILVYSDEKLGIPEWSQTTKDALLGYVQGGGGLVVYHHSAASFQQWPEYKSLVGCIWRSNVSHHSPVHNYKVDVRDQNHPIMRGMKSSFMAHTDELYAGLECIPTNELDVLATGWDDHTLYRGRPHEPVPSSPSQDEPVIWTHSYGKGKVFTTVVGNDMRAVHTPGFISTFVRGTEWAATGEVTIPPMPEVVK
jgi:hypothetical protein